MPQKKHKPEENEPLGAIGSGGTMTYDEEHLGKTG